MKTGKRRFSIYYQKTGLPRRSFASDGIKIADVLNGQKYAHIREFEAENVDEIYREFQALPWSTVWLDQNCERDNRLLGLKGVHHTSLSVGDVIYDIENDKWYICEMVGWRELE